MISSQVQLLSARVRVCAYECVSVRVRVSEDNFVKAFTCASEREQLWLRVFM